MDAQNIEHFHRSQSRLFAYNLLFKAQLCRYSPIANSSQSSDHLIRHKSGPRYDNETFRREA